MLVNKEILIGKYLSGNASPEETKKLMNWIKEDPSNQVEFEQAEKFWNLSLNLKKEKDADVENAWSEFKSLAEAQPEIHVRKTSYKWWRVAAAIALFMVMGIVVKLFYTQPAPVSSLAGRHISKAPVVPATVSTPDMSPVNLDTLPEVTVVKTQAKRPKQRVFPVEKSIAMITISTDDSAKIFLLPDNSIVYLNANSKLEYPENFNKTNRRVSLTGEAYFEVKKDSGQFVVACENTIIRGKATSFNVKSHAADKEVEVIVAGGKVEFSGIGYKDFKKLVLNAGESGVYNKSKSAITKIKHVRKNHKWWQKKSLRAKIREFFDKVLGKKNSNKSINPGK
jgi:transmembrane sensor